MFTRTFTSPEARALGAEAHPEEVSKGQDDQHLEAFCTTHSSAGPAAIK